MVHELKTIQPHFDEVSYRRKTFEIRKDDRDYQVGDTLKLKEWTGKKFTGQFVEYKVTHILRDAKNFGLNDGFIIMSIQ